MAKKTEKIAIPSKIFAKHKERQNKKKIKSHGAEEIRPWLFAWCYILMDIARIYNSFSKSPKSSSGFGFMFSSMAQGLKLKLHPHAFIMNCGVFYIPVKALGFVVACHEGYEEADAFFF